MWPVFRWRYGRRWRYIILFCMCPMDLCDSRPELPVILLSLAILSVNWRHIHWPSLGKGENKGSVLLWYSCFARSILMFLMREGLQCRIIIRSGYVYFTSSRKNSWLAIFTAKKTRTPQTRTYNLPHPNPMFHSMVTDSLSAIWLFIKQFDRQFRPSIWPTPTH